MAAPSPPGTPQVPKIIEQACAVPFLYSSEGLMFCLITSIRKGHWGFPKGIIDPGETPEQTALKEAREEAGLSGRILGGPLGYYFYEKWDTTLHVTVFLMEVTQVADHWDEEPARRRVFHPADRAAKLLAEPRQAELLQVAVRRLSG